MASHSTNTDKGKAEAHSGGKRASAVAVSVGGARDVGEGERGEGIVAGGIGEQPTQPLSHLHNTSHSTSDENSHYQNSKQKFCRRSVAAAIVRRLVELEYRRHGDLDSALRRLAGKSDFSYSTWRRWWHARIAGIEMLPSSFDKLLSLYDIECSHHITQLLRERKFARWLQHQTLGVR